MNVFDTTWKMRHEPPSADELRRRRAMKRKAYRELRDHLTENRRRVAKKQQRLERLAAARREI